MKIGIIGAGMIGSTLGALWVRHGHHVRFGTRHPERVAVSEHVESGTALQAADFGDAVLLAVPYGESVNLGPPLAQALASKLLMDAGNPYPQREPEAAAAVQASGEGSGIWTARHFPSAHVVKAFNTVFYKTLQQAAGRADMPIGIPLAGDDPLALALAEQLVRDAGFVPLVVGPLSAAVHFDIGTAVWNTNATVETLRAHFRVTHGSAAWPAPGAVTGL